MMTLSLSARAAIVTAVGVLAMRVPPRRVHAVANDSGCIRACCFCVDDDQGVCSGSPLWQDTWCMSQGGGPFVECSEGDLRCDATQTLIECVGE